MRRGAVTPAPYLEGSRVRRTSDDLRSLLLPAPLNTVSTVFAQLAMSLDGYIAPEGMTADRWNDPGYKGWGAK